jgi:hypothetical protein
MYSVLLSDCTITTYILLPSLECQGRDCLSRLYLDCGYCLARFQKDITALYQPTNEKVGYITVLETLTGPTEITLPMYEYLLKRKLTKNGTSVSHQNRHQCLVSTIILLCICSSKFKYSSAQDCFQLRLLLDNTGRNENVHFAKILHTFHSYLLFL